MLIASFALIGLPFYSGFYSKEFILESSFYIFNNINFISFWLGSFSALFTAIYSFKIIHLSFFIEPNNYKTNYFNYFHIDNSFFLNLVLFVLGISSIFSGFLLMDLIIGNGSDFLIFNVNINNIDRYSLQNLNVLNLPHFFSMIGIIIASIIYNTKMLSLYINSLKINLIKSIFNFTSNAWFIENLYNKIIAYPLLISGYKHTFSILDQGYIISNFGYKYFFDGIQHFMFIVNYLIFPKKLNELLFVLFINYLLFIMLFLSFCITNTYLFLNIFYLCSLFALPKKKVSKKRYLKIEKFKVYTKIVKFFIVK